MREHRHVGALIARARKALGWKRDKLARVFEISKKNLKLLERGEIELPVELAGKVLSLPLIDQRPELFEAASIADRLGMRSVATAIDRMKADGTWPKDEEEAESAGIEQGGEGVE